MNELQLLNDFIINHFESDNLVNTISIVPTINIDANKENIYPLTNVDLINSEILPDAIIGSYKLTIITQRDIQPKKTNNKLLTDTNYLDNINETHAICVKFVNNITRLHNDENIMIENLTTLKPLKNWGAGGCDGFQFEFDLSIHNKQKA